MRPTSFSAVAALCAALLAGGPEPPSGPPAAGPAWATTAGADIPGAAPAVPAGSSAVGQRTVAAPAEGAARVRFRWPLDGPPRLVRRFDPPPQPWLPGHRGVDLAAVPGAIVRAAGPGTVLFAGLVAGRPVVTVGHAGGLRTTHEPVQPAVRRAPRSRPAHRWALCWAGTRAARHRPACTGDCAAAPSTSTRWRCSVSGRCDCCRCPARRPPTSSGSAGVGGARPGSA